MAASRLQRFHKIVTWKAFRISDTKLDSWPSRSAQPLWIYCVTWGCASRPLPVARCLSRRIGSANLGQKDASDWWGLRRNLGKIMEDPGRPPLTTFLGSESISLGFLLICPEFARPGRHNLVTWVLSCLLSRTPWRVVYWIEWWVRHGLGQRMRHWDFSFHHGRCCFASSSKFKLTSNWHT